MAVSDDANEDNYLCTDNEENPFIKRSNYYDLDEFNLIMKKYNTDNNISVLNINARSLVKHINEFTATLSDLPSLFDVITVEETWLSDTLMPLVTLRM